MGKEDGNSEWRCAESKNVDISKQTVDVEYIPPPGSGTHRLGDIRSKGAALDACLKEIEESNLEQEQERREAEARAEIQAAEEAARLEEERMAKQRQAETLKEYGWACLNSWKIEWNANGHLVQSASIMNTILDNSNCDFVSRPDSKFRKEDWK